MNTDKLAKDIMANIGGTDNVNSLIHCATRLRFRLKDEDKANTKNIQDLDGVLQVVKSGGQYQVVIGPNVGKVYNDIHDEFHVGNQEDDGHDSNTSVVQEESKSNWFNQLLDTISAIFTPFIGILAAAGMLKGFAFLLQNFGLGGKTAFWYNILTFLSSGIFTLLPLFIAVTAARRFKTNEFIALAVTAAMIYPLTDANVASAIHMFGLNVPVKTYSGAVIPAILVVWFQKYVERYAKKWIPAVAQLVLVPTVTLLITSLFAFAVIGPIGSIISSAIGQGSMNLYNFNSTIAGALLGGLFQVLVIFGLHWGILPIGLINIQKYGYDTLLTVASLGVWGQFGAVIGAYFILRRLQWKKDEQISISAMISGFFGITEPAIYGINLKYKVPFIIGSIAGAVGGAISGFFKVKAFAFSPVANIFTFSVYFGKGNNVLAQAIAIILTLVIGAVGTALFWKPAKNEDLVKEHEDKAADEVEVTSPVNGTVVAMSEVKDNVFKTEAMGPSMAVNPDNDSPIYAPVTGKISFVADTKHAIGFVGDDGIELLLHMGIDTVKLDGKYFDVNVKADQHVTQGEVIGHADWEAIRKAGYDPVNILIGTNSDQVKIEKVSKKGNVQASDALITLGGQA